MSTNSIQTDKSIYRYRRTDGRSPASAPCEGEDSPDSPSEESSRLQQFFERLGLDPRDYDAIVHEQPPESPVYFSSASTVDSNQLAATADYTVTFIYLFVRLEGPNILTNIMPFSGISAVFLINRYISYICMAAF